MANPFDKFDTKEAMRENPFDRFDKPGRTDSEKPDSSGNSEHSGLTDFLSSIPRGLVGGVASAVSQLGRPGTEYDFRNQAPTEAAANAPNPEDLTQLAEKHITGPLPQPEGGPGRYGNTLGQFVGNPLSWLGPGGMVAKGASAAGGAIGSEGAGQLASGTPWEAAARLAGALAGGAAGPRAVTPVPFRGPPASAAAHQRDIAILQHERVPLRAGDVTDSQGLKYLENTIAPENRAQQEAFTRAATRRVPGTETPVVVHGRDGTIDRLLTRTGDRFDRAARGNDLIEDAQLQQDHADIYDRYLATEGLYPPETTNAVRGALNDINRVLNPNNIPVPAGGTQVIPPATMTGQQYQTLRSRFNRASMGATDPQRAGALREIVESLDDAMERNIARTGGTPGEFAQARRDYRNALVLEKAVTAAGKDTARGYISPNHLANAAKVVYGRRAFERGLDDFSDLANAGQAIIEKLPNSGTAQRTRVNTMMRALGTVAGAGVGLHLGGGLQSAGEGGLIGFLAGEAAGPVMEPAVRGVGRAAVMNPVTQRWLKNQTIPQASQYDDLIRILRSGAVEQQAR